MPPPHIRLCTALASWTRLGLVAALFAGTAMSAAAQTRVVVLGSGTPVIDPDKSGPAAAVVVNGTAYLVDCGMGTVERAAEAARRGHPEVRPEAIGYVFITHLHSDHTLGLPALLLAPWVLGRTRPPALYGPAGLADMIHAILAAWSKDIDVRTQGLEHLDAAGVRADVHEIAPGIVYHDANVTVSAFPVHHGSWDQAFGYRFQTADRTIVFSGDTSPVPAVAGACDGCDLLFHEVYNRRGVERNEPGQLAYFAAFHTSAQELGPIASAAHPKLLVLYHQVLEGLPESDLMAQVRQAYAGAFVSAHDLDVY